MKSVPLPEYAITFWLGAVAVCLLGAHVFLGWLARARRRGTLALSWPSQLASAAALGSALCASAILSILGDGPSYALGWNALGAVVMWLGTILACHVLVALLVWQDEGWAVAAGGILAASIAVGCQMGWVWAAGLRPGVLWQWPLVGVATALCALGSIIGLWASGSQGSRRDYDNQSFMRRGASALLGVSLMAGHQVVVSAAVLSSQRGSAFREQLPGGLVGLACGVLLPLTFIVMAIELSMRNHARQQRLNTFRPERRQRRRHKIRTL